MVLTVAPARVDIYEGVEIRSTLGSVVVQMDGVRLEQVTKFGSTGSFHWWSVVTLPLAFSNESEAIQHSAHCAECNNRTLAFAVGMDHNGAAAIPLTVVANAVYDRIGDCMLAGMRSTALSWDMPGTSC